jgi:hypothetical protein
VQASASRGVSCFLIWNGSATLLFREMSYRWGTSTSHCPLSEPVISPDPRASHVVHWVSGVIICLRPWTAINRSAPKQPNRKGNDPPHVDVREFNIAEVEKERFF